jgi:phosphoglycerol transferase MdoB-like AlkP superfamily enzyme
VSDEDLFERALAEFDRLEALQKPFFATLLTVSNHRPYTYPLGRIPETTPTRANAVKYADWALGRFFQSAKSHRFYDRTLFVVMGDHGARVYGRQYFPMKSYRIPVLLIAPEESSRGQRCSTLGCTLDIAPTILGRLGGAYRSVFFGSDILATPAAYGRAVMQHNHDVALLDAGGEMVVLGFNRQATGFGLDPATFQLNTLPRPNPALLQTAAALFQTAYDLYYSDRWYPDPGALGQ